MNTLERLNDVEDPHGPKGSSLQRLKQHFLQEVSESWIDSIFLLSCFVTGLLDSSVFNIWSCFVSMQTGNTIYAGLGVFAQPKSQPLRWVKSITSIVSFCFGALTWSRFLRLDALSPPLKRSTLFMIFLLQALLIYVSASLVSLDIVTKNAGEKLPDSFIVLLPLALLSFGQAAHIVLSKTLGFPEITAVVITSAYADFCMDETLLTTPLAKNIKNNRRAASAILLFLGAVSGSWLTQDGDIEIALWISGSIKVVISGMFLVWKRKEGIRLE